MTKRKPQSNISKKGEQIYREEIKDKVEPELSGQYLALNVKTKKYFVADDIIKADQKARRMYPKEIFYIKRIGSPATVSFRSFRGQQNQNRGGV